MIGRSLEKVVGDYLHHMSKNDMDYPMMLKVYRLIQQGQSFDHLVREYNETYFRELMWSLQQKAWQRN